MYLGVQAVIAKSFARIHWANLINFGILPLVFEKEADYDRVSQDDQLEIEGVREGLAAGRSLTVKNITQGFEFPTKHNLSERQRAVLLAGGLLNYVKRQ
jgi:aconitate hydratase